jgi:glycosyltransferase involved in cell wall biosynthesis
MPVYNGEKYLRFAIESILAQSFSDFEFLIINDGSTDNSVQIIQSYNDSRIRLVHNEKNLKLISTLNKGINLASGKYIARMDCDDISLPKRLAKQVSFMHANPNVGVLGTGFQLVDGKGKRGRKYRFPAEHHFLRWSLCFYCPFAHPAVMMRKDVVRRVGGYNHEMIHAEDYDLWYRLANVTHFSNLQNILLYLRKHDNNVCKIHTAQHYENTVKINQKVIYEIVDVKMSADLIMSLRARNYKPFSDFVRVSNLIQELYNNFYNDNMVPPEDKKLIRKDAAFRLFLIAAFQIYDFRTWNVLRSSLRLDPSVLSNAVRFLFSRISK